MEPIHYSLLHAFFYLRYFQLTIGLLGCNLIISPGRSVSAEEAGPDYFSEK